MATALPGPSQGPRLWAIEAQGSKPVLAPPAPPRIWAIEARRAGDHSQVLGLLERLGEPFEVKRVGLRPFELLLAPPFVASRLGVDPKRSSLLEPPWPDLVVASGREGEAIARWVRERSKGHTRLVQLGRPWGGIDAYDLVVTTPQYRLPRRSNVVENPLPLHRVTDAKLASAAAAWSERLPPLPRPWLAVLLGGHSLPYVFDAQRARRLAQVVSQRARRMGGALLVTSSKRTRPAALAAFRGSLAAPAYVFDVQHQDRRDNPFFAFLALADEIIVTGDSASMAAEATATGKPVHLFDLGEGTTSMRSADAPPWFVASDFVPKPKPSVALYRLVQRLAPANWSRHLARFHHRLVASGQAVWLGDAPLPRQVMAKDPLGEDPFAPTLTRVRALLDEARAARPR